MVGLHLYSRDAWIGTGREIFAVFFAAFITDFAIDALISAIRNLK